MGQGHAFCINHCCCSRLKTSASSACSTQSRMVPSQPVCSPSSWHHGGQTRACRRKPEAAGWARGHKNLKNPGSGMAEQQFRPLLGWFRERNGRSVSRISVNLMDLPFICLVPVITLLPLFPFSFCCSFFSLRRSNLLRLILVHCEKQPQQSWKSPKVNNPSRKTWQLMSSVSISVLSLFLCAEPSVFISALHYVTLCLLSITSHPQEDLEVSWRK